MLVGAETDTLLTKKVGKKKKKKTAEKDNKENVHESKSMSSSEEPQVGANKVVLPAMVQNNPNTDAEHTLKGKYIVDRYLSITIILSY